MGACAHNYLFQWVYNSGCWCLVYRVNNYEAFSLPFLLIDCEWDCVVFGV